MKKVLTEAIARLYHQSDNTIDLSEFDTIEDDAAKILGDYQGPLNLSGLTHISNLAATSLSKYRGNLKALVRYKEFTGEEFFDGMFVTTLARYQVFLNPCHTVRTSVCGRTIELTPHEVMRVVSIDQEMIARLERGLGTDICGYNLFDLAIEESFCDRDIGNRISNSTDHPRADPLGTIVNTIGQKLIPIKDGVFTMGSPEDEGGMSHESQHQVVLSDAFYMSMTLVTQKQFSHVMGFNPRPAHN